MVAKPSNGRKNNIRTWVITDFMMPEMDGGQLMKVMSNHRNLKEVPVILMSSAPETTLQDKCSGYVLFVRKPFNIYNVIELVARALNSP